MNTVCAICGKKVKSEDLIPVKIEVKGVGIVYDVCLDCVKANNYTEYDGSDWASDWN